MSSPREPDPGINGSNSAPGGTANRRLNPTAVDFIPATRTPSKRKASSSAPSGTPNATTSRPDPRQVPVLIDEAHLFADPHISSNPSSPRESSSADWSDLDEIAEELLGPSPPVHLTGPSRFFGRRNGRGRAQDLFANSQASNTASQSASRLAALLIQAPSNSDTTQADGEHVKTRYLPLHFHKAEKGGKNGVSAKYTILASHASRIQNGTNQANESACRVAWPRDEIPVELFELITAHLARDDAKSLRLVNKEFERKVAQQYWRTAIVPFNTELYDMIVDETKSDRRPHVHVGKGKEKATKEDAVLWTWQNANEDKEEKVYKGHGLRVFQGFGPYIKKFGMSFEVSEDQLAVPPGKQLLNPVDSYHGTYEWPSINYARFAKLNRLEDTADETSRMKTAFSSLGMVSELGLSVRNGLGWLEGPDKSFYATLLQQSRPVFGSSSGVRSGRNKSGAEVLSDLRQCVRRAAPGTKFKELVLEHHPHPGPDKIPGLSGTCYAEPQRWSASEADVLRSSSRTSVLALNKDPSAAVEVHDATLNPSELKKEQKEWLLETEWAQRAFLESYVLAVMDNPAVSSRVTTLCISELSSGLLPMLSRAMFWDALPSLSNATVHIGADWRIVEKDEAAYAETRNKDPSEAVRSFHDVLLDQVSWRDSITSLDIGWADGGEHAQGMFARNSNILPAPISTLDQSTAIMPINSLVFPNVKHLTLTNCWISPPMLQRLTRSHASQALEKLTLNSVSVTTYPHPSTQAQQAQAAAAALVNFQQMQFQQNNAAAGNGQPHGQHIQQGILAHQQLQQIQQQWQQLIPPNPAASNPPAPPQFFPGWAPAPGNPNAPIIQIHHNQQPFPPLPGPGQQQPATFPRPLQWTEGHRQGSWPDLLNAVSPGPTFTEYLPAPPPWEQQPPPRPDTNLTTIELVSCGYARLEHNPTFDQTPLLNTLPGTGPGRHSQSPWFYARAQALKPYMLDASRDKWLGSIVQHVPPREVDALRFAWGLRMGWVDRGLAEEAEFDGFLLGGTGRVSGSIWRGMPLVSETIGGGAGGGMQGADGAAT